MHWVYTLYKDMWWVFVKGLCWFFRVNIFKFNLFNAKQLNSRYVDNYLTFLDRQDLNKHGQLNYYVLFWFVRGIWTHDFSIYKILAKTLFRLWTASASVATKCMSALFSAHLCSFIHSFIPLTSFTHTQLLMHTHVEIDQECYPSTGVL